MSMLDFLPLVTFTMMITHCLSVRTTFKHKQNLCMITTL